MAMTTSVEDEFLDHSGQKRQAQQLSKSFNGVEQDRGASHELKQSTPGRSARNQYSFIQRGNMSIKSAGNQANDDRFHEPAPTLSEQQRTQILLTLCIELTLCLPRKQSTASEEDL